MEISLPMVTARDFPMRLSRVFRCPGHCVHYDLGWWRFPVHWVYTTHQVSVNVKLTCIYWFTGLDILACEKLNPDVFLPYISPCCFERGVEWILLVPPLFQAYFCRIVGLCDTFIVSKWIWQVICNVLQIFWTHGSDLWVRGFEAEMCWTFH